MIAYYGYITTMSWRASIALEELGLDYRFNSVNIGVGEQFTPAHTARNPMQKVPVIVDHDQLWRGTHLARHDVPYRPEVSTL